MMHVLGCRSYFKICNSENFEPYIFSQDLGFLPFLSMFLSMYCLPAGKLAVCSLLCSGFVTIGRSVTKTNGTQSPDSVVLFEPLNCRVIPGMVGLRNNGWVKICQNPRPVGMHQF